jgi:nucleoside-diphosphate-sugar epimerase
MNVLVTGATGFIGRHVVEELLRRNHAVTALAIETPEQVARLPWISRVTYCRHDMNRESTEDLFAAFSRPDAVIHLAWEGLPHYGELYHFERNLWTNYRFLKNLVTNGLKSLTVIGTCFEYGMRTGCLSEDMPAEPANPYALAKDTLRKFLEQLAKKTPFHFKWIRLFYLYGPGQSEKSLIPQLEQALERGDETFNMSGGEQVRDFLPVARVAEYIAAIALQDKVNGIVNCCSGAPVSVRAFVEQHLKSMNKSIRLNLGYYPYSEYEPMAFWGDDTKLRSILNA